MTTPTTDAPVQNLRTARKEQAVMRKEEAAKAAPAKKAPAKKAPAKAPGTPKLKWTVHKEYDAPAGKDQSAAFGPDGELGIERVGDEYRAILRVGKKETVLASGGFGKCYLACTAKAKGGAA